MAEYIIADNEERKEWNRSVDQVLIALVDRNDILAVKHNSIQDKVKTSIAENGSAPGMFAGIVKKQWRSSRIWCKRHMKKWKQ